MPKQKCRDNRKARKKRDAREAERIKDKLLPRFDKIFYRLRSVNPDYYDVVYDCVKLQVIRGKRVIDLRCLKAKIVPNDKYRDLLEQLNKMCGHMTVNLTEGEDDPA